jgi:hypothetical protein
MTCGIGVKPSREISARTSIIGTYFLSALEAPAPMPLPSLVGATRDLRSHIATMPVPLHLLTSLVSATVSTRTIEYALRQVVRVGSGTLLSADTKRFNHARLGTILPVSGVSGSSEAKYAHA